MILVRTNDQGMMKMKTMKPRALDNNNEKPIARINNNEKGKKAEFVTT